MAKVSVVIPFHNRIEWTKEAIQSVLTQTFQDFEIIVVDDGSEEVYKTEIEELDNRILYFRQANRGVSAARNVGIRHSSGQFVAFLDSDDSYLPEKLEIQVKAMDEHPNVLLSHTSYNQVNQQQELLETIHSGLFTGNVYPQILAFCPIATPTVMLRRECLAGREFYEQISVAEDVLLWSQIAKESPIIGIATPLASVRIHGSNALQDTKKQLEGLSNIVDYGLNQDLSISNHDRNLMLCHIYHQIGTLHFRQKRVDLAVLNVFRSLRSGWRADESFYQRGKFLAARLPLLVDLFMGSMARQIVPKHVRQRVWDFLMKVLEKVSVPSSHS